MLYVYIVYGKLLENSKVQILGIYSRTEYAEERIRQIKIQGDSKYFSNLWWTETPIDTDFD